MARKPRIHYPGAFYHVMLRGNGGQDIFFDDKDFQQFLDLMSDGLDRFGHKLHAYCLMSNHIHLLIEVDGIPLSKIMQNLSFRYTRYINKKHKRMGHLFQGRYRALLVDADSYLLTLLRYIHDNPVKAGIVKKLKDWPWSSHHYYQHGGALSDQEPNATTLKVYTMLGPSSESGPEDYTRFMARNVEVEWPPEQIRHDIVGSDHFVNEIAKRSQNAALVTDKGILVDDMVSQLSKLLGVMPQDLKSKSRNRKNSYARGVISYVITENGKAQLSELASFFGRDVSGLSRMLRKLEQQIKKDNNQRKMIEKLNKSIRQA